MSPLINDILGVDWISLPSKFNKLQDFIIVETSDDNDIQLD